MKKLIHKEELGVQYTNRANRIVIDSIKSLLGLKRLNALYDKLQPYKGVEFAKEALNELNVTSTIVGKGIDNIPAKGAFIAIANYPHGALDGLLAISHIIGKRDDAKLIGTFLLHRIEPLKEQIIAVNPLGKESARNTPALRQAQQHLKNGGGLIIFPAGEVSTYQNGLKNLQDKEWGSSIIRFIRNANVPIIPIHISGSNSMKFHLLGKIHPTILHSRLALELLNKKKGNNPYSVYISVATPIGITHQKELKTVEQFKNYLRANIYYMKDGFDREKQIKYHLDIEKNIEQGEQVAEAQNRLLLKKEIELLPRESIIFNTEEYLAAVANTTQIPYTIHEIFRLRELSLRMVGQGSGKSVFEDQYERIYKHLFVWSKKEEKIVGSYRLAYGKEIVDIHGIENFYSFRTYEFSPHIIDLLRQSIEISLPFISPDFRKSSKSYSLLWQAMIIAMDSIPFYRYILGESTISSGILSTRAKSIAISYIIDHHWNQELSEWVIPRRNIKFSNLNRVDISLVKQVKNLSLIEKLIADMEMKRSPHTGFFKRSLEMGSSVISYSHNSNNNNLEALLLLDVNDIPESIIRTIKRDLSISLNFKNR